MRANLGSLLKNYSVFEAKTSHFFSYNTLLRAEKPYHLDETGRKFKVRYCGCICISVGCTDTVNDD